MTQIKNKIGISGRLRVSAYDRENKLLFEDISNNLVVNQGLQSICRLLGGDTPSLGKPIAFGRVGTNATAADHTDTVITGSVGDYPIDSVSYPSAHEVTFVFSVDYGDSNGMNIREYGLFNEDARMYCRIVKPSIVKDVSFRLECEWTLDFTAL
jgi:hypothetical protein